MTNSLNPIAPADSDTLLSYRLLTQPDPLQVDGPAILTLVVSKSPDSPDGTITCSQIVVTLPEGKSADTLTPDASGIETQVPKDSNGNALWSAANDDGVITLTPTGKGAGLFRAQGVSFVFAKFKVNHEPGTTTVSIDETASADSQPAPTVRTTGILVPKFPEQFSVSDLVITPAEVAFGGSTSVMWSGTPATYTLQYPGSGPNGDPVSNVGPFEMQNLTTFPAAFTLTVSLTVPGQDTPLVVQRQKVAELLPQLGILSFDASAVVVSGADVLGLTWEVQLATSLTLQISGIAGTIDVTGLSGCSVASNGSPTLVVSDPTGKQLGTLSPGTPFPQFLNFLLTASNSSSGSVQRGLQIQVAAPMLNAFWWTMRVWPRGEGRTYFLNWATANAAPVSIQPGIGGVGATGICEAAYGQTYTLYAPGFGATLTSQQTPG